MVLISQQSASLGAASFFGVIVVIIPADMPSYHRVRYIYGRLPLPV